MIFEKLIVRQGSEDLKAHEVKLSKWLYIGIPVFLFLDSYLIRTLSKKLYRQIVMGEGGFTELATVLFLLVAIAFGIASIIKAWNFPISSFKYWLILMTLGCIYYAGEEASWGQHIFKWGTPETWQVANDHQETNLHNLADPRFRTLFRSMPNRALMGLSMIFGFGFPILCKIRNIKLDPNKIFYWISPSLICAPTGFFVLLTVLNHSLFKFMDWDEGIFKKIHGTHVHRENIECLLAVFLMFYLIAIYMKLKSNK